MKIRSEQLSDAAAIRAIHTEAFGHGWEADLIDRARGWAGFDPAFSLVADDGEVVGHVMFTPVTIEDTVRSVPAVVLAPLAVRADRRGAGVGRMLVEEGLRRCKARGDRIVAVYGGPYYDRFGFTLAREAHIYRPDPVPGQNLRVLALCEGALSGVSGVIRYPAIFAPLLHCTEG